jgi:hypothetical protein
MVRRTTDRNKSRASLTDGFLDLLIGLVLAQGVHGPNRCRNPPYQGYLQDQANNAGNGSADCEEG